jgi:hypothetical protein
MLEGVRQSQNSAFFKVAAEDLHADRQSAFGVAARN